MDPTAVFHVAIKAEDVDATVEFYREHFDATVVERGDPDGESGAGAVRHVALEVADKRVYVFDRAPYEATGLVPELSTGFLHVGFVVEDIAAAAGELSAAGVEFIMDPTDFGDLRIAFLTDPTGTRIELLEHRA